MSPSQRIIHQSRRFQSSSIQSRLNPSKSKFRPHGDLWLLVATCALVSPFPGLLELPLAQEPRVGLSLIGLYNSSHSVLLFLPEPLESLRSGYHLVH